MLDDKKSRRAPILKRRITWIFGGAALLIWLGAYLYAASSFQPHRPTKFHSQQRQMSVAGRPEFLTNPHYYKQRQESVEWQAAEVWKEYPGQMPFKQHGILGVDKDGRVPEWTKHIPVPLDRNVTDSRHSSCKNRKFDYSKMLPATVVIIFCNEDLHMLMRSVHSVLNRTPPPILREVLLVDDASTEDVLKPKEFGGDGTLQSYIDLLPKVRYHRLQERGGIVGARLAGAQNAKGDIFVILDSHVEVQPQWLEPLVSRITEDTRRMVMPQIDGLERGTLQPLAGGIGCTLGIIWKVIEHSFIPNNRNPSRMKSSPADYVSSPTMAGGLFAAHKEFFMDIGGYDSGMAYWGTENVELSFRLWQCGGSLECTECSRVYHLFGGGKRYSVMGDSVTVNKMRTITAWMDKYADLAWRVMGRPRVDIGDMTEQRELRDNLKCRDFEWFLDNVWPESDVLRLPEDVPYYGPLKNLKTNTCLRGGFIGGQAGLSKACMEDEVMYFRRPQQIKAGRNDESCLTVEESGNLRWDWCSAWDAENQKFEVLPDGRLRHVRGMCLGASGADQVKLVNCELEATEDSEIKWDWKRYNPPDVFTPPPNPRLRKKKNDRIEDAMEEK